MSSFKTSVLFLVINILVVIAASRDQSAHVMIRCRATVAFQALSLRRVETAASFLNGRDLGNRQDKDLQFSKFSKQNDNDSSDDRSSFKPDRQSSSSTNGRNTKSMKDLLGMTMNRAIRTLHSRAESRGQDETSPAETSNNTDIMMDDLMDVTFGRASDAMRQEDCSSFNRNVETCDSLGRDAVDDSNLTRRNTQHVDKRTYLANPNVTPTALAHSLWAGVIRPHVDTVIDATCGNGKDACAIAKMLFPPNRDIALSHATPKPELLCIDVQNRACRNTLQSLLSSLDDSTIITSYIRVLHASHAPLPVPRDSSSVGLVCYNLGYLPGGSHHYSSSPFRSNNSAQDMMCTTQMVTTLSSITDASLLLRVGGLLSVMTYPGTNLNEANAVRYFCEGLALLSSKQFVSGWQGFVDTIPQDDDNDDSSYDDGREESDARSFLVRETVRSALEKVVACGSVNQTWRVFDHRPLGRTLCPILVTAFRIK